MSASWSLQVAVDNLRGAQEAYARAASQTRRECAVAADPPSWWPKSAEHSHAALTRRLERLERGHDLAAACLLDLRALFKLAREARDEVTA